LSLFVSICMMSSAIAAGVALGVGVGRGDGTAIGCEETVGPGAAAGPAHETFTRQSVLPTHADALKARITTTASRVRMR
jgi:hypothetical protein